MSSAYSDYFARDYMSNKDFGRLYGLRNQVTLRIMALGVREARDPNSSNGRQVPKPMIWFVEHPDLPMFVSKRMHESFLDRFGIGYDENDNRWTWLYAPVRLRAEQKEIFGEPGVIVEASNGNYEDHTAYIGEDRAQKFRDFCKDSGVQFDQSKFRWFVQQNHPAILHVLEDADGFATLPMLFRPVLKEFVSELQADLSHAKPQASNPPANPPKTPDSPAPTPPADPPADEPNFEAKRPEHNPMSNFDPNDIPF